MKHFRPMIALANACSRIFPPAENVRAVPRSLLVHAAGTLCAVAAIIIIGLIAFLYSSLPPFPWTISSLKKDGAPIIASLERYRNEHGRYPKNLDQLGPPTGRRPGWTYRADDDGRKFELTAETFSKWFLSYDGEAGWELHMVD